MTTDAPLSNQPKRPYHSLARERQAEESRQRMLKAAQTLFLQRGYDGTTLDAIAGGAGLSPKTVTAAFGSKRGVLAELLSPSTFGQRYQQLLDELQSDPEPMRRIELVAQMTYHIYEKLAPEFDLLRGAVTIAPELAELSKQIDQRRRQKQEFLVIYLTEEGRLRPGLAPGEALDELWVLTSYDLYRMLVVECSWTPERYETWLTDMLRQRLLAP